MTRLRHGTDPSALFVSVSPFFSLCASSQMIRSCEQNTTSICLSNRPYENKNKLTTLFGLSKRSAWMRKVSYDTIITCALSCPW